MTRSIPAISSYDPCPCTDLTARLATVYAWAVQVVRGLDTQTAAFDTDDVERFLPDAILTHLDHDDSRLGT